MGTRARLDFSDALDGLDAADWGQGTRPRPAEAATIEAAQAAGFRSREPTQAPAAPPEPPRRRRTGRNAQLNLKARPETIAAYCRIADAMGWGLGETLERAVELLKREHGT